MVGDPLMSIRDVMSRPVGVVFADLNDDGWPDIYVTNDSNPNLLFHNNGDGTFSEDGLVATGHVVPELDQGGLVHQTEILER